MKIKKSLRAAVALCLAVLCISLLSLTISAANTLPGDLNNDGSVNTTDVVALRRYIADGYGVTLDEKSADLNTDGYINTTDVVMLRRYIAGGYGVELNPLPDSECKHTEVIDAAIAPTCTASGLTEGKHCSVCGEVLVARTILPATGHAEVTDAAVAPTCTATGLTEGKHCSVCGEVLVARTILPATGHAEITDAAVAPTCTATGLTEGKHCSVCGSVLVKQTIIPKTEHQMMNGQCSVCGYHPADYTDATAYSTSYGYDYLGTLSNGTAMQTFYSRLNDAALAFHTDTSINADTMTHDGESFRVIDPIAYSDLGLNYDNATKAMQVWRKDHPIYYWLQSGWFNYSSGKIQLWVEPTYADGEDRAYYNNIVYRGAEEYVTSAEGVTSDYLLTLCYHDAIIDAINYAYEEDGKTPQDDHWAHRIIGVMTKQGAVCEGYAKTLQLLLNFSGVENIYVTGQAGGGHAWNLIRLDDGGWYWCDPTWNDKPKQFGGLYHNYFCINDTQFTDWYDLYQGWSTPQTGSKVFGDSHTPEGILELDYLPLPARSETVFDHPDILELRETFTLDGMTFARIGFRRVQLVAAERTEALIVPETVTYNGFTYTVVSVGAIDENGFFVPGSIFPAATDSDIDVKSITLSDTVERIFDGAFADLPLLTSFTAGEGLSSLGGHTFLRCYALTEINLPDSLSKIGWEAFCLCTGLTKLDLPNSVSDIAGVAFNGCRNLTSLTLPDGITLLAYGLFMNCESLTSVVIPASVTEIGFSAFSGCYNLTDIIFNGTTEQWNAITKADTWNVNTGSYTIHCTDGDITK